MQYWVSCCYVYRPKLKNTVEPCFNDIRLRDTPSLTSHILWYQLIPHC
jgi:hypothetical protein